MSKLNWYWAYYPHLDAPEQQKESALHAGYIKVVSKDEADKVIAELEQSIESWTGSYEASRRINARTETKLRHQKYKRCLAMAKVCYLRFVRYENYLQKLCANDATTAAYKFRRDLYGKWEKRWLELAEKFKEAK